MASKILYNAISGDAGGECKLVLVSSTSLALVPRNGNSIRINGVLYAVPDAGVSVSNSGLSASTNYYVYAYMNSGTMTLEFSTTGHSVSTTGGNKGTEIKTGDDTRSLVGFIRTSASTTFLDTLDNRFVRSWFNEAGIECVQWTSTAVTTTSASSVVMDSGSNCNTLLWEAEKFICHVNAPVWDATNAAVMQLSIGLNGVQQSMSHLAQAISGAPWQPHSAHYGSSASSDGLHVFSVMASVTSGTLNMGSKTVSVISMRK